MKRLIILMCAFFAFTACKKTAEDLPGDAINAASQNDAVTARNFTFDASKQQWSIVGDATIRFSSNQGNPEGSILGNDVGTAGFWYFKAPPILLQDLKSGYFLIKFDLKSPVSGVTNEPDIRVIGDGIELVANIPGEPDNTWKTFSINLNSTGGWRVGTLTGAVATNFQIKKAFGTIKDLLIRGDFTAGAIANKGYLDNVIYTRYTPPPTASGN